MSKKTVMLTPIIFENDHFLIHPFRQMDADRYDSIVQDIHEILSDEAVLRFIPEKRLNSTEEAKKFITGVVFAYQSQKSFTHFITIKELKKVLGVINIFPPNSAKEAYKFLPEYNWMIEYYINRAGWGRDIMSEILPAFIERVFLQGIEKLGAACFPSNVASIRLLKKAGFIKKYKFDNAQDYYEVANESLNPIQPEQI